MNAEGVLEPLLQNNVPVFQQQVKAVEDINQRMGAGETLLHHAAKQRNPFLLQLVLNKNADVAVQDCNGLYPLHYAVHSEHLPSMQVLLKHNSQCEWKDNNGWNPLHHCVGLSTYEPLDLLLHTCPELLQTPTDDGHTLLHIAAQEGNVGVCKLLLELKADVDAKANDGTTSLHLAALSQQHAVVRLLLEHHADAGVLSESGSTALDIAIETQNEAIVTLLGGELEKEDLGLVGLAVFPYNQEILLDVVKASDLEFEQNEIITNINKVHDDWWEGRVGDRTGLFPAAFVSETVIAKTTVSCSYSARRDDELTLDIGDTIEAYQDRGNGWYRVICNKKGGLFPSTHMAPADGLKKRRRMKKGALSASTNSISNTITKPVRRSKSGGIRTSSPALKRSKSGSKADLKKKAEVVKKYSVQHVGDLELVVGATIDVTKSKGAWWEGICNGEKGIFPAKCVKLI